MDRKIVRGLLMLTMWSSFLIWVGAFVVTILQGRGSPDEATIGYWFQVIQIWVISLVGLAVSFSEK